MVSREKRFLPPDARIEMSRSAALGVLKVIPLNNYHNCARGASGADQFFADPKPLVGDRVRFRESQVANYNEKQRDWSIS